MIWEYKAEIVKGAFHTMTTNAKALEDIANRLGKEGWELVSCTYSTDSGGFVMMFKRRVM